MPALHSSSSSRKYPVSAAVVNQDVVHSEEQSDNRAKEIKDAKLIFNQAWKNIEDHYGLEDIHMPREITFLMGAPGSGKGTHTPSILRSRGITNPPIHMSELLTTPECKELINKGQMISDKMVLEMLFHALLKGDPSVGVLVDGFPRTEIQVECLKLLYDKMQELRTKRPVFRIAVLYVDEDISVQRQLARGKAIREHNAQVKRTGQGQLLEERVTDSDETLIRARYAIFKAHYGALLKLSKIFPFHLINAVGSIEQVMHIILKEFEYQSSLELESDTYDTINHIPLAAKIGIHARQDLIARLEHWQEANADGLSKAVSFIEKEMIPHIRRNAISGHALVRSDSPLLKDDDMVAMIMDVLSERGFHVSFDTRDNEVPVRIDLTTGKIELETRHSYVFSVHFPKHHIQPLEQKFQ
ncbi:hypothetical protein BZG36_01734 [Bifiguratus adelaidae]|uniref:Adenylate kinase active site lid domain-containing protein n=1 Tax=Bifiguratus adelaidae TaxID=1938954 RepID=A0A261Y2V5_9FUNG|nr:hypothetical protein BZG36_01734 [Bifiguratus adelaidae]